MLVLKGFIGLHRTVQLQLLQNYWLGHRLGLPWYCLITMIWFVVETGSFTGTGGPRGANPCLRSGGAAVRR